MVPFISRNPKGTCRVSLLRLAMYFIDKFYRETVITNTKMPPEISLNLKNLIVLLTLVTPEPINKYHSTLLSYFTDAN
jgi:hypothetical protein